MAMNTHIAVTAALIALGCAGPATGAEFKRADIVTISGRIEQGDYEKFVAVAEGTSGTVVLDSGGGEVFIAMKIGYFIRNQVWATSVAANAVCNSACVLIWIAGVRRQLDRFARLGLHSASTSTRGPRHDEFNRRIASYLREMDAPREFIDLWPRSDPSGMNFVYFEQAEAWGLVENVSPSSALGMTRQTPKEIDRINDIDRLNREFEEYIRQNKEREKKE
jgi:hypothetical protein